MLYCKHCYAKVQVGADNAPTSLICKFCNQVIEKPVELVEYAGLVAQQKHKKIVKWKNILSVMLIATLCLPFIMHWLLIFSQKPHEFYNFAKSSRFRYFMTESYKLSSIGFFANLVFFGLFVSHFLAKLNYITFKKRILWFALPFVIIAFLIIYWESTFNVKFFPLNPWLAKLEIIVKIVQVIVSCCTFFIVQKYKTVHLAFRSMYLTKPTPIFILIAVLAAIIYAGISSHARWYKNNVYDETIFLATSSSISSPKNP